MIRTALDRLDARRPLVRPSYNQFEVACLPPFGDPEVNIPGEVGTYVVAGAVVGAVADRLDGE